jgi:hypothetical protein
MRSRRICGRPRKSSTWIKSRGKEHMAHGISLMVRGRTQIGRSAFEIRTKLARVFSILSSRQKEKGDRQHEVHPDQHHTFHPVRFSVHCHEAHNQD